MIQHLRGRFKGKTIALVGSGPTANKYTGKEHAAIVINGASLLDAPFDIFTCFDLSSHKSNWFMPRMGVMRVLGIGIAQHCQTLYPSYPTVNRKTIKDLDTSKLVIPPPHFPHLYFRYTTGRANPTYDLDLEVLSACGNIAICGLEEAFITEPAVINIYGIDLAQRRYFYENRTSKGKYTQKSARYFNELIKLGLDNGVEINVAKGDLSNIVYGGYIG